MYQSYFKIKQNECLICFNRVDKQEFLLSYKANPCVCLSCFNKFNVLFKKDMFNGYPILYLYEYNDFFKSLLFRYKGQYDIALAKVFLSVYKEKLKRMYRDHIIVVAPSSKQQNRIRGFKPMYEIAKSLELPIFTGLYKKSEYKQSDQSFENRKNIYDIIDIENEKQLENKKILIIDDVMTSGNTLLSCAKCVEKVRVKSISFLILSKRV